MRLARRDADDETDGDSTNSLLDRRSYLLLSGAAVSSVMLGSGTGSASASRRGISFDRVLDAVDDLGMDPTGEEFIDDRLDGAVDDGTLIEFPPGEYVFERERTYYDLDNFGIRGTGESKNDVVIRPRKNYGLEFFRLEGGDGFLFENLTLDQRDTIPEWNTLVIDVDDRCEIHDIEYTGHHPSDDPPETATNTNNAQGCLRFRVNQSDGVANISGLVKAGPSDMQPYPNGGSCIYIGTDHLGTVNISDCFIANMSSHAMYGTQSPGTIRVENCTFKNNNGQQCRVSGDGAVVRNCRIVIDVDNAHPDNIYPDDSPKYNSLGNGIWTVSQTDPPQSGGLVEDTEIICRSVPDLDGTRPWLIECDGSAGPTTYRNVHIHTEADGHGIIRALDTTRISLPAGWPDDQSVTFDGVTITGTSSGSNPALDIRGRDATVENCCIDVDGDRDGLALVDGKFNSPTGAVSDTNINVGGTATVFEETSVETTNITYSDSCPAPDFGDGSSDESSGGSSDGSGDESTTGSTDGSADSYEHALRVMADDGASPFEYTLRVSGPADLVTDGQYAATPEQDGTGESVTENADGTYTVEGIVAYGGGDSFAFDGDLLAADLGGPGTLTVDGEPVDTAELGLPNTLTIVGNGEYATYELSVDGDLAGQAGTLNTRDEVSGTTATGGVGGGSDAYEFSGSITDFTLDGRAAVYLNGTPVDPDTLGDDVRAMENLLVIDGTGSESRYSFEVTGDVTVSPEHGPVESVDAMTDSAVEGAVNGDIDAFRFTGQLAGLSLNGTANITFEDVDS